jgi:REP-associated tyrosine transposase
VKRINDPNHARFLTFSTFRQINLFVDDSMKDAFAQQLDRSVHRHGVLLYAWVLMPNHVHLIVREPKAGDLEPFLKTLKTGFAKRMVGHLREIDSPLLAMIAIQNGHRFWQRGGGYDRNINSDSEFDDKVGYIHMNPVRAGLVDRPIDWKWGSARWWGGERENEIECAYR